MLKPAPKRLPRHAIETDNARLEGADITVDNTYVGIAPRDTRSSYQVSDTDVAAAIEGVLTGSETPIGVSQKVLKCFADHGWHVSRG